MKKRFLPIAVAVIATGVLTSPFPAPTFLQALALHPTCQTFPATGKTVCGAFLAYWQQHGGLPIFGYPISAPFPERSTLTGKTYTVQYFERAVFEAHPENRPPYDVQRALLGTYRFHAFYPHGDPGEPYTDNLPLYPDAQNVQITHGNGSTDFDTTMVYVTKAQPAAVLTFYKDVLLKDAWSLGKEESDLVSFVFEDGHHGDGGVPGIDVIVKVLSPTQTQVTVQYLALG